MKRIAIFGASGHGQVVAEIAEDAGWNVSFYDDSAESGAKIGPWNILGNSDNFNHSYLNFDAAFIAIGDNRTRLLKATTILSLNVELASLIHKQAVVSKFAEIGPGSVVMPGAVIGYGSKIGICSIINTGATVDHHCHLDEGVHISPGSNLAGNVRVGKESWMGIGSSVRQGIQIGCNVIVGAGATVVKNISNDTVAVGTPARPINQRNK